MNEDQTDGHPEAGSEPEDKRAVEELMHAVSLIPAAKKASFLRAMREAPALVESESNPLWFLKLDNYNYWKAAERLVQHWSEREALFRDRVHLPLTQTGNGALTPDDVMSLHTGTYAILPKSPSGQSVFFIDRGRALANATPESRLRAAFYVLAFLAKEANVQNEGIIALSLLVSPRVQGLDHGYAHRIYRMMNTFPIKINLHLLNCLPKTGKHVLVQQVMTAGFAFASMYFGGFQVFTEKSGPDMLSRLTELGLAGEGVPVSVGGTWTYENFTRWCRERTTEEQTLDHLHRNRTENPPAASAQDEESKRERMRTLNVIHSRQKRERRKAEQRELKDECEKLQSENRLLKEDNKKLEALLTSAQQVEEAIKNGRIKDSSMHDDDNLKKPAALKKPADTNTTTMNSILNVANQDQSQGNLQVALQGLMNQPPEVQALALFILQNALQPQQQQQQQQFMVPPPQPQQQATLQQPSVDHGTLTQVLLSSIGQVRTTQTPAQAPVQQDIDLGKLVQILLPGSNQNDCQDVAMQGGVASSAPITSTSAQSNVASAATMSTGGTDSLVTLVTLLLLQAQQQK